MSDAGAKFGNDICANDQPLQSGSNGTYDDDLVFPPPANLLEDAHVSSIKSYQEMYRNSINDPNGFWRRIASELYFESTSDQGLEWNFDARKGTVYTWFMKGSKTNLAYNCLERNIKRGMGDRIAFMWEGNEPCDTMKISYQELLEKVINFSAVLRSNGVKKGDVVAIYLPMTLELPIAMLACARIGAIHSVIFAGFSAESIAKRVLHARACVLITADGFYRGPKFIALAAIVEAAVECCSCQDMTLRKVIVLRHLSRVTRPAGADASVVSLNSSLYIYWDEEMERCKDMKSNVEWCSAEDPLFILYTSGSTGAPKGIMHTTAGYMTYVYATAKYIFDAHYDRDIYWCMADCGWITGHSYVVYGPLMNGLTSIMLEGIPTHPSPARAWQIVEKYKITTLYTAPTVIRALMALGDSYVLAHDRSSLAILGTVGEPINPSAWLWFYEIVGEKRCAVVDTYWQTETGGIIITPLPRAVPTKPGSATLPFFGVVPIIVDAEGCEVEGPGEGNLCLKQAWPGISRTIYGDHERFISTYFTTYPGYYFTGDGARRDRDGYIWATGRVDDLINVSGHLLSTAEIESALTCDVDVVEAACVAAPHDIKGSFPYAFVLLRHGENLSVNKICKLKLLVRKKIGAIAIPDVVQQVPGLPKTRSGKVTRRILRKIAEGDRSADLGDTSTLVDQSILPILWEGRTSACHV